MWTCIRCKLELTPDHAPPEIDSFGVFFICPECGRRNNLHAAGKDAEGGLWLKQIDPPA